jgi:hypothetical protein
LSGENVQYSKGLSSRKIVVWSRVRGAGSVKPVNGTI